MVTCKELDRRLNALDGNFKALHDSSGLTLTEFCLTYRNPELELFARDLHQLLLSEGFDSWLWDTTGMRKKNTTTQNVGLRMLMGPDGWIRIVIRYDGSFHLDCGSDIPLELLVPNKIRQGAIAITTLIADLHETVTPTTSCYS